MTTHPTPTGTTQPPRPTRTTDDLDEFLAAANADILEALNAVVDAPGADLRRLKERCGAPGRLPTLGMLIRDAERLGQQMIAVLGRQWDPTSGPLEDFAGVGLSDVLLSQAVAEVRSALHELAKLAAWPMPPAGSAVQFPARQDPVALPPARGIATTGGPDQAPGPSPRRAQRTSHDQGVRRGVGPVVLGIERPCVDDECGLWEFGEHEHWFAR